MKAYHTSQFSTLSSQLSSCPQIFTEGGKAAVQGSRFKVQSRQAHYALCIMNYELLRRSHTPIKYYSNFFPFSPPYFLKNR